MGYETRRKSINLQALGVPIPQTYASKAAARLSPLSTAATPTSEHQSLKKMKRYLEGSTSPPRKRVQIKYEPDLPLTPPPSEVAEIKLEDESNVKVEGIKSEEIDLSEVKDEIVEAVIIQLQKTGNRPHLVKELAAILSRNVDIVEKSANQCAIISSRLATYLKRPWSASSPCPVGKESETVHPRRTYFYLTTYPHQPIPDPSQFQRTNATPPTTDSDSNSDGPDENRGRSLSPEVDLSSEEYDDTDDSITPPTPTGSFSGRLERPVRNNRASSVGLEKDEKEFTQAARGMQNRRFSGEAPSDMAEPSKMNDISGTPMKSVESDPFFEEPRVLNVLNSTIAMNSPAMKPAFASKKSWDAVVETSWKMEPLDWDTRSPETIELDELDGMLDDF